MSLELKIEALTAAVTALTAQLQAGNVAPAAPVAPTPAPVVQAAPVVADSQNQLQPWEASAYCLATWPTPVED